MPKSKEKSSAEYYRKIIRSLQKQVRQLEKEVTHFRKRAHQYEESQDDDVVDEVVYTIEDTSAHPKCEACSKGRLFPKMEFPTKTIVECDCCGARKSIPHKD